MNQDFPWHWVAMVVIAFISWIFSRIQEATAERQRVKELQRRRAENRDTAEPAAAPPPLPAQREPGPLDDLRDKSLRELIEALGGAPQPTPEPRQTTPPPRPAREKPQTRAAAAAAKSPKQTPPAVPAPSLSAAERAALERLQAAPKAGDATTSAGSKKGSSSRRANAGLPALLRSPAGLRQAIVLKELLDKPVSLR
jgi:hypothetical protein